jgi:hypothetical protein
MSGQRQEIEAQIVEKREKLAVLKKRLVTLSKVIG